MITRPTVFILGAGASAEYGFPLGHSLVQSIIAGTTPNPRGHLRVDLARAKFAEGEVDEFFHQLRRSDSLSIDAFLEGNQHRFQQIGKAAIAITILRAERDSLPEEKWLERSTEQDHWLRYVWSLMRSGCNSPQMFAQNHASFVTFNYDRTLEWYFPTVLAGAFNLDANQARVLFNNSVPVVHLHGTIADRDFGELVGAHLPTGDVIRVAAGIRVVSDLANEPSFATAWDLFKQAQLVCILGFGYHPTNIARLRLVEFVPLTVPIAASTYKMGNAEVSVAFGRIYHPGVAGSNLPAARSYKAESFLKEVAQIL